MKRPTAAMRKKPAASTAPASNPGDNWRSPLDVPGRAFGAQTLKEEATAMKRPAAAMRKKPAASTAPARNPADIWRPPLHFPGRVFSTQTLKEEKAALLRACEIARAAGVRSQEAFDLVREFHARVRANEEVLQDAEVALACVRAKGDLLGWFCSFAGDKALVLEAVRSEGSALRDASEALRGDKEVVLAAVGTDGSVLRFASEALRGDKEVVMVAVSKHGSALKFASEALRGDKEVVMVAVSQYDNALGYVSEALRGDKEVVLAAVSNNGSMLFHANQALRGDKEVVLTAVSKYGDSLADASQTLRGDKEVVLAAVSHKGLALKHASQALREDKEVVTAAVRNSVIALRYADAALRADRDFVLLVAREARWSRPLDCYKEAHQDVKDKISEEQFISASESSIALPGDSEKVLQVTLSRKKVFLDVGGGDERFHAEIALLSGTEFACDLPRDARTVNDLAEQLIQELEAQEAKQLLSAEAGADGSERDSERDAKRQRTTKAPDEQLWKPPWEQQQQQQQKRKRVFITFLTSDGDVLASVTPWDHNRPLSDYLCSGAHDP